MELIPARPAFLVLPAAAPLRLSSSQRSFRRAAALPIARRRRAPACVAAGYPRREGEGWSADWCDEGASASQSESASPGGGGGGGGETDVVWETVAGCRVASPGGTAAPLAIVHFVGGFGLGGLPGTFYRRLASGLAARAGVAVVCAPVPALPGLDHAAAARGAGATIAGAVDALRVRHGFLHTLSAGHSLGARLQAIRACAPAPGVVDAAAVLLAVSNASTAAAAPGARDPDTVRVAAAAAEAASRLGSALGGIGDAVAGFGAGFGGGGGVPLDGAPAERLRQAERAVRGAERRVREAAEAGRAFAEGGEFSPSPEHFLSDVRERYAVPCSLVVSFERDSIDCSDELADAIREKCGAAGLVRRRLKGTHVTPVTPDIGDEMESTGNAAVDEAIQGAAGQAREEFDALVTTVAAFVRFVLEEKIGLPRISPAPE